jgi:hypothetical protein
MRMVNLQTNALEEVPDDAVSSAWGTTHGFDPSVPVPIRTADGDLVAANPHDVEAHLANGGEIATEGELHQSQLEAQYGGVLGSLAAGGEGVARGLSLGLSDPLAIKAAEAFGGKGAADKVREHLAGEKEAHPYAAGGGEIAGAILPVILSEGGAAPEEAAIIGSERLATEGAGLAAEHAAAPSLTKLALSSTPASLSARAGLAAERATANVLSAPVAESALGRIATAAAKHAAAGSVEGAIYGAGGQLSEDALGDHELNGEKLAAAIGHGALYGLLLGGGGGALSTGAKEIAAPMLRKAAPFLDKAAGEQMWKALDPLKKYSQEASARAGGTSEIGKTLLDKLGIAEGPITEAALTPAELAPKIDAAVQRQGADISEFLTKHGATEASIPTQKIIDEVDSVIAPLRGKALHEGVVSSLEDAKASLLRALGVDEGTEGLYARARSAAEGLGHAPGSQEFAAAVEQHVGDQAAAMVAAGMTPPKLRVGFTDLLEQRKAIDQMAFVEAKALNPKMRVKQLREIRQRIAGVEVDAIDDQAKKLGLSDTAKADYLKLKKDYQRLVIAQDAATDSTYGMATNRNLSLSDYASGIVPGLHAAMAGHPMAAAMGLASSYGHRLIRQNGNALAAATLSKISRLDFIARGINQVDKEMESAAKTLTGSKPKLRIRRFNGPDNTESPDKKFEHAYRQGSKDQMVTDEHVERMLPGLAAHAPKVTAAMLRTVNAASIYAASTRPVPLNAPTLADPNPKPRVSLVEGQQHYERVRAAQDPVGTLRDGIQDGRLTPDMVQTIAQVAPRLLQEQRQAVMTELSKPRKTPLSSSQVRTLSVLFDGPGDATMTPEARATFQASYAPPSQNPQAQGPSPSRAKPIEGSATAHQSSLDRASLRH